MNQPYRGRRAPKVSPSRTTGVNAIDADIPGFEALHDEFDSTQAPPSMTTTFEIFSGGIVAFRGFRTTAAEKN